MKKMKMGMKMEKTTPPIFSDKKDIFFQKFATSTDVLRTFSPDNWGAFLQKQEKCFTAPKVSLVDVAEHYGEETAKELIKQQFIGLLRLCSAKEWNTRGAEAAADLFNSLYGRQITPYGLMLYFALYPTKYKDTFREFDAQDVLKQCGKFLEWWQAQQQQEQPEQQANGDAITINELVFVWLSEGRTIEQIKQGGLYRYGMITDAMIAEAKKQLTSQKPF